MPGLEWRPEGTWHTAAPPCDPPRWFAGCPPSSGWNATLETPPGRPDSSGWLPPLPQWQQQWWGALKGLGLRPGRLGKPLPRLSSRAAKRAKCRAPPASQSQVVAGGSVLGGPAVSRGRQRLWRASQPCGVSMGSSQGLGGHRPFCRVVETKAGRPRVAAQRSLPRRPWCEARQLLRPAGCHAGYRAPLSAGVGVGSGGRFPCGPAGAGRRSDSALAPGGVARPEGVLRFSCMFLVITLMGRTRLEQADAFTSGAAPARPS